MTDPGPADPSPAPTLRGSPSEEALALFAEYLRTLEGDPSADFERFRRQHEPHDEELAGLLEEYERISRVLERLAPAASFSARLREHYGDSVDPGISIAGGKAVGGSAPPTPGSLRDRLTLQTPETSRYEVRRELARGGMGAILEVWDRELRRTLAMKVVLGSRPGPDATESVAAGAERRLSRFLEEAQITGQLDHPGIVPVHDIGLDEEARVYFTMQLVDGMDLRKVIEQARARREDWSTRRVVSLLVRVCEAMAYAHSKGVVHRDLKPANIMVGAFGEVYVMDWGLARVLQGREGISVPPEMESGSVDEPAPRPRVETDRSDSATPDGSGLKTLDGDIVGTPSYMSPEQARGRLEEVGPGSDVYAVGAILYHLLAGQAPYEPLGEKVPAHVILDAVRQGPPWALSELDPEVDGELAAICEKAMARARGDRYPSMMRLALDLRNWVEGRGVGAYTSGTLYSFRKWVGRNRALFAALTAIPVLLTLTTAAFILLQQTNLSRLEDEREKTQEALDQADASRREALDSAREKAEEAARAAKAASDARDAEELAQLSAQKARTQTELAQLTAAELAASSYRATLSAAAYSLRLDDADSARRSLEECRLTERGWEWRHLSLRVDASEGGRIVQEQPVTALAVSADGSRLATYGVGLRPRVWDAEARRLVRDYELQASFLLPTRLDCCLAPDGSMLALTEPANNAVVLLDAESGELRHQLTGHRAPVIEVKFSPDGRTLATAGLDGVVRLFGVDDGEVRASLEAPGGQALALAFSPDGGSLVVGGGDGSASVWDLGQTDPRLVVGEVGGADLHAVDWSPEGDLVLLAGEQGRLETWSARTGELLARMHGHRGVVRDALFSEDGRTVISVGDDHTVHCWDARTGRSLRTLHGHVDAVRRVVRIAGGRIATSSLDGTVRCWDPSVDRAALTLAPPEGAPRRLWFEPDSDRVYGVLDDGRLLTPLEVDAPVSPTGARMPQGERVPVGVASGTGLVARSLGRGIVDLTEPGGGVRLLEGLPETVNLLALSDEGTHLAVGARRRVVVVELETGARRTIDLRRGVARLALAPDGRWLATAEDDESLRLWDTATGQLAGSRRDAHSATITALAFSPGGDELATGSRDETGRVWSLPALDLVGNELGGLGATVTALGFHPTEGRLATGTSDGRVLLWSVSAGNQVAAGGQGAILDSSASGRLLELFGHGGAVQDLAFSPDGSRLVSSGEDGNLRVWRSQARR